MRWSVALLSLTACLPPSMSPDGLPPTQVTADEHAANIAGLRPPKRARPTIAIVTSRAGAETTDLLVPFGVLRRSGVAEVSLVAPEAGVVELHPALAVRVDRSFRQLDAALPEGPDYVIVPALHDPDDPEVVGWVRRQAERGAVVVGVCSGARVLSAAGLLDGRRATGHWADLVELTERHPTLLWVRDRRYVVDRGVVTTTGVSASIPISLALVEAISTASVADALAAELGAADRGEAHDSDAFHLGSADFWTAFGSTIAPWNKQRIGIPIDEGVDEIGLALAADAYARTFRSRSAAIFGDGRGPSSVGTRSGAELVLSGEAPGADDAPLAAVPPGQMLDATLAEIARRFGAATARLVAVQIEYPWRPGDVR